MGLDILLWLAAFALGAAIVLGVTSVVRLFARVRRRDLRHMGTAANEEPVFELLKPFLERTAFLAVYTSRMSYKTWAKAQLQRAGLTRAYSPELMETLKLASTIAVAIIVPPVSLIFFGAMYWSLFLGLAAGAYFVPDAMLWTAANARVNDMRRALPFTIDLIAVSAEAGMAFQLAVANVIENSKGAEAKALKNAGGNEKSNKSAILLSEFEKMLDDMKRGRTLQQAVVDAADRVDFSEFRSFASAIAQTDRLGTPISETLRRQSAELQTRIAAMMEEKANQAPIKILFPLIVFIFPTTGWVIIGPILIQALGGR